MGNLEGTVKDWLWLGYVFPALSLRGRQSIALDRPFKKLQAALGRLERYPARFGGISVASLCDDIREFLRL